ncbi:MAG: carboxypeptidase regulatory-like domain-containing protein, partial [Candidatus Solibacter usitatus]|nr:carboxypeptidase regulatory-like domain-containing protein [Candidatus Solibacter usitatus]
MYTIHIPMNGYLLPLLLLCAAPVFGQAGKAQLFGTIQDPTGLAVPQARVQVEDQATRARYAAVSDERGEYRLLGLKAGEYILTVEQPGFKTHKQSGITLRIEDKIAVDVKLDIGQQSESVEVTGGAPLLQTASGDVSFNVDQARIVTLPLDGRNFIPLVALSPGVALPGGGSLLPRINGGRPRTNEYMYDG